MRLYKKTFFYLLLILGFIYPNISMSQDIKTDKINSKFVYDYESILSDNENKNLEEIILKLKNETKKEILVVTTHSLGPIKEIQEYATYLRLVYNSENKNEDVIVIAVSKTLRKIGISTSTKSREIVSDEICTEIINQKMIPEFKNDNFFNGIKLAIEELTKVWRN